MSASLPDDSLWSSLAQELGLDSTPTPAPSSTPEPRSTAPQPTPIEVHPGAELSEHLLELPDATEDEDTSLEPALSGEAFSEGEGGEEDEPGEGGKRRRRRRRRRKKGAPGTEGATEDTAEAGVEPAGFEDEPATETRPTDALRDVIVNWNVPTWDELIGGLYRPGN